MGDVQDLHFGRVLVIGLDGGTWSILDRFAGAGCMPNLSRLIGEGYRGTLLSTVPPLTPVAWTSFATGTNPGKHGVFGFMSQQQDPTSYSPPPVRRDAIKGRTLWRRVSDAGLKAVVLSVPMTYPPEPINGYIVTGMFTPGLDSDCTYPPWLKDELLRSGCMPKFQLSITLKQRGGRSDSWLRRALADDAALYFSDLDDLTESLRSAVLHLIGRPWDLFVAVFTAVDKLQHLMWPEIAAFEPGRDSVLARRVSQFYERIDDVIGEVLAAAGEDTVVLLMSDHGFGPCVGSFSMARWLVAEGYAHYQPRRTYAAVRWLLDRSGLKLTAQRLAGGTRLSRAVRQAFIPFDWSRTRAYFVSGSYGLRVNLKGREEHGIVEAGGEYDSLCHELREKVLEIRDPVTGKSIIERAWLAEEVYDGPELHWAPDVVMQPNGELGYHLVQGDASSSALVVRDPRLRGSHRPEGIFLAAGPGVRAGVAAQDARIEDVAPTVLWLLGLDVPPELDGVVIREAFTGHPVGRDLRQSDQRAGEDAPPEGQGRYSDAEERRVRDRLRSLGYID